MTHPESQQLLPLTYLLARWRAGEGSAFDAVIEQAFVQLKGMAAQRLGKESAVTLNTQELLSEIVIRLMEGPITFRNRAHFFATASLHMRSVLVDHARARHANKRGTAWVHVTIGHADLEQRAGEDSMALELLALDEALRTLESQDPRAANVLHLVYFVGLDRNAIAEVLGISVPTVDRDLRFGRAWLSQQLNHEIA